MLAIFYRGLGCFDTQATALIDMNSFAFVQTWAAQAILIGAPAVAGIRYAALPGWLAWSGAVVAVLLLASVPLAVAGFAGANVSQPALDPGHQRRAGDPARAAGARPARLMAAYVHISAPTIDVGAGRQ